MELSIITISRNYENLLKLLHSIEKSQHSIDIEVLCAWNGEEKIKELMPFNFSFPVTIYQIKPYNFAENNNTLAKLAKGKKLLFINDDIILDEECLNNAMNIFQQQNVGIAGINLRYPSGKIQHAGVYFKEDGKPYHRYKNELFYKDKKISNTSPVPAVTGAFIMINKDEFMQIKFDESFRVAGEDIALCLNYRRLFNKEIVYVADATAIHIENDTRKKFGQKLTPEEDMNRILKVSQSILNNQGQQYIPKIRIITENPGWILHRKALEIQKRLKNIKINEEWPDADIHYYINYGYLNERPKNGLVVANFTHYDPDKLGEKFVEVAKEVDHCIAVSPQTVEVLKEFGVPDEKISMIIVGADSSFQPKLTLGIVGRTYPGGRKGEHIINALISDKDLMDGVQVVSINEGWGIPVWAFNDRADFYRSIDYLLVPSLLEGGPVPFMEALACGTLAIAPPIGVIPMFPHIEYPTGDIEALKVVINDVKRNYFNRKNKLANYIKEYNWDRWAYEHEKVFSKLVEDKHY